MLAAFAPPATYCPSCDAMQPASAFLSAESPDSIGAFLRCSACISDEVAARRFIRDNRRAVQANPTGFLAASVRAARAVAASNVRAARAYAERLQDPASAQTHTA